MAQNKRGENENSVSDLSFKVTMDTSEAVAELKRLQRVARQVAKELREVEAKFPLDILRTFTTQELADELMQRSSAETFEITGEIFSLIDGKTSIYRSGPAKVIAIYDGDNE